jgi:hypothetical protein
MFPINISSTATSNGDVAKRQSIQWTYGEKLHILRTALTAKSKGESFVSVAKSLHVSEQTIYGLVRDRIDIEEVGISVEGGTAVTRNRKNDNLRTINLMVLNELAALKSGTSTMFLIKEAKKAGVRLRTKLLKEQCVASNELARLENFKASRPWARKLVVRLRNDCMRDTNAEEYDQSAFGLTSGNTSITSSGTKNHRSDE